MADKFYLKCGRKGERKSMRKKEIKKKREMETLKRKMM